MLHRYAAGSKLASHEVEHLDLSNHEEIKHQIPGLSSLASLPLFDGGDDFVDGLRFYVIVLKTPNSGPIYCFRVYSPKKELSRSTLFGALLARGQFDAVRNPLFLFDQHVDCVCHGDTLFILNKSNFQKVFRFFEMVLGAARKTLETIRARVPIAGFDKFQAACEGHLQKLAKLKNIADNPELKKITMAQLRKVIQEFKLPIEIRKEAGKEMLVFDPRDPWALLHLLDQDYLKSPMTGNRFEVSGKRLVV